MRKFSGYQETRFDSVGQDTAVQRKEFCRWKGRQFGYIKLNAVKVEIMQYSKTAHNIITYNIKNDLIMAVILCDNKLDSKENS